MSTSKDTLLTASAVAISAGLITFLLTKRSSASPPSSSSTSPRRKNRSNSIVEADSYSLEKLRNTKKLLRNKPAGTLLSSVSIDEVYLWEVENLVKHFDSEAKGIINKMHGVKSQTPLPANEATFLHKVSSDECDDDNNDKTGETHYNKLIRTHECIMADLIRKPGDGGMARAYVRAGPRRELHFDPASVSAAIVTCGGLCPGLNNVVREITNALFYLYGIEGKVYGIRGGYKGFYDPKRPPIELDPDYVENIHHAGGTVLSSSRGGFDLDKILNFLRKRRVKQLYVIGGDGTHRGAFRIHEACVANGMNVAVAGIPKTIDNDIDYIDRSFGFSSAVEAAQGAIRAAKTEATCNLPNGIGIVKLMGRSAGFIAVHATMGSGDVDLCLVPEVPIDLDGPNGCLPHLMRTVKSKGYAVVVVAEGAGEELLGESSEFDASGNKRLPKIGDFMKRQIEKYFQKHGDEATVKFIDPSYMIRSVPANAADSLYCMQLAQNAVHGAMAGFTGFTVGLCNNKMVFLPIPEVVATSPRMMNPRGRTWERVLALTRQPNTVPRDLKPGEKEYDSHAPMLR